MRWSILVALLLALHMAGCIQMPTEKQEVVDLRPQLSFSLADPDDDATLYRVYVDGLDMGTASNYLTGKNGMKVLSGTHIVKIEGRGRVVLQEKVFLGEGATRALLIPRP